MCKLPYKAGTLEAEADKLVSELAWARVTGERADDFANLGEQAEEFKRLRRLLVPRVVEFAKAAIRQYDA